MTCKQLIIHELFCVLPSLAHPVNIMYISLTNWQHKKAVLCNQQITRNRFEVGGIPMTTRYLLIAARDMYYSAKRSTQQATRLRFFYVWKHLPNQNYPIKYEICTRHSLEMKGLCLMKQQYASKLGIFKEYENHPWFCFSFYYIIYFFHNIFFHFHHSI